MPNLPLGNGQIGNLARSSGRLARIVTAPCAVPTAVWVETAIPAVLRALYSYESPDKKHLYHQVVGHSLICTIKQEIREAREATGGEVSPAERFLFRLAEVVDQAIWYLFLAAVGVDALIDWTSMAYEIAGCTGPDGSTSSDNPFGGTNDASTGDIENGFEWLTGGGPIPSFGAGVVVRPRHSYTLIWLCSGKDIHQTPVGLDARLLCEVTGEIIDRHVSPKLPDGSYQPATVAFHGTNDTGVETTYHVVCRGTIETDKHIVLPGAGFCHRGGS